MMRDNFKFISGMIAIGIYLLLLLVIVYYFNYRTDENPVNYVAKNSNRLDVTLASSKTIPKQSKQKRYQKKIRNITSPKPKKISKPSKKPAKKIKAKSLFSSIKTHKIQVKHKKTKHKNRTMKSASKILSNALKNKNSGKK